MNLENSRVLVTGGAGFIGSEVVKQLSLKNNYVTILDNFSSGKEEYLTKNEKNTVIRGDICDEKRVSEAVKDQEYIIHLAALPFIPDCYNYPQEFFNINTIGTLNLAYSAVQSKTLEKLVYISTSEVYGTAKYIPMDEDHPTLPHSTYAVSKLAADRAIYTIHKEQGLPATIIRPFNSYGPNITQPYIIPEIIFQLRNGANYLTLGNVESSRDFTYVSDTARAMILALTSKQSIGETINVGSGMDIKIRDLAMLITKLMKKDIEIKIDKSRYRPFDVTQLYSKNEKARELLNWKPEISMEEGLSKTIAWAVDSELQFNDPFRGWSSGLNHKDYRNGGKRTSG
ncbi:MAG: NAD-dependent epimerase/dehydratase family protein [Candidatus Hodarchaeales archaeon]|jgi:dTDP-glucose 4,6-dehydratase